MAFDPKDVQRGDEISAQAWNDMAHAIRAGTQVQAGPGVFAHNDGHALLLAVSQVEAMDFRITGGPDENGGYDWKMVVQDNTTLQWKDTAVTGKASEGNGVYPRGFGLPFPANRQQILIPPVRRVGNYLHIGVAWLSMGIGNRLPASDQVYHAVRAEGSGKWVFDAVSIDLSTTSDESIYICCKSSSSSSTSHDHCPNDCGHCDAVNAPCSFIATVENIQAEAGQIVPPVPNPQCMNGSYTLVYQGGCTWYVAQGQTVDGACADQLPDYPNNETSATLTWDGSNWVFTITDGVSLAEWISPDGSCFLAQIYHPATTMSNCGQDAIGARVLFPTGG